MKNVIIIGGGGHSKVLIDLISLSGDNVYGILDDNLSKDDIINNVKVLGKISDIKEYSLNCYFIIGIGNIKIREKIINKFKDYNLKYYTAIHKSSVISPFAKVNKGTVIMANCVVNANSIIKEHCIINTGAVIEHDNIISENTHISPGATLCGTVKVGKNCHIGAGSTIINNIEICSDTVIGAGSTVISNINESGTYVGTPAKKIK